MEVEAYIMIYEIKNKDNILRIIGEEFYNNNYNKGKILYNNKKINPFKGLFNVKNISKNNLKIRMILSKDCYNKAYMFKDCSSILELKLIYNIHNFMRKEILFNKNKNSDLNNDENKDILFNDNINIFQFSKFEEIPQMKINLRNDCLFEPQISVMNEIFYYCFSLISLTDLLNWDTSNAFDISKLFYNCKNLSFLSDIFNCNTKNVIDTNKMFYNCSSLFTTPYISNWNNKNASNIDEIFSNLRPLISFPNISKWKDNLFYSKFLNNAGLSLNLQDLPIENNNFQDKYELYTNSLFEGRSYLKIKLLYEISGQKKIKIFDEEFVYNNLFKCIMIINNKICSLNDEYEIYNDKMKFLKVILIILNNVKINFSYMFYDCHSLVHFDIISNENKKIKNKITKHTKNNFKYDKFPQETLNKSENSFNTIIEDYNYQIQNNSNLLSFFDYSSENDISIDESEKKEIINSSINYLYSSFKSTDVKNNDNEYFSINKSSFSSSMINIDTKKPEVCVDKNIKYNSLYQSNLKSKKNYIFATNLSYMFYSCSSLLNISGLSKLYVNNVINMNHMFKNCSKLKEIKDIFQLENNKLSNISFMFSNCSSLISIPDISKWNVINVENMSRIFINCKSLSSMPDISNWKTQHVKIMDGIFAGCKLLTSLPDISKWDINSAEDISGIFADCSLITSLPNIAKWKTINIKKMSELFIGCSSLKSLPDISNWNTDLVTDIKKMFVGCSSLNKIPDISKWNTNNIQDISFFFIIVHL